MGSRKNGRDVSRWQQVKWAWEKWDPPPSQGWEVELGDASLRPCGVSSVGIRAVEKDRDRDVWAPNQPGSSCAGSPSSRDAAPGEGEQCQQAQEQLQAVEEEQDGAQECFQAQGICLEQQVVHGQHGCRHCKSQAEGQRHLPLAQVPLGACGTQSWDQIMGIMEDFGWGRKLNVSFPRAGTPSPSPGCSCSVQAAHPGMVFVRVPAPCIPCGASGMRGTHRRRCAWPQCRGRGGAAPRPAPS